MKVLTLNFLTCARKACKQSPTAFPLHPKNAELEAVESSPNPQFLRGIIPRLEWDALRTVCTEARKTEAIIHYSCSLANLLL